MEDSYAPCDTCGNCVDDGSYTTEGYLCHDCLDNLSDKDEEIDQEYILVDFFI